MKKIIYIIILFLAVSCTKEIYIYDPDASYAPVINLVSMDSTHVLSVQDTTFLRINVWAEDQDGADDIEEVIYFIKREDFYIGDAEENSTCEYQEIFDDQMFTTSEFILSRTTCHGGYDSVLEKVCEELNYDECQNSTECLTVNPSQVLFYTFQSFKPSGFPDCGGFGTVKFQFQITDSSGLNDLSQELLTEILLP